MQVNHNMTDRNTSITFLHRQTPSLTWVRPTCIQEKKVSYLTNIRSFSIVWTNVHCLIVCSVEYMYNEVFFLVLSVFAHTIIRSHVAQYQKRFQQHTSVRIHVRNLPFYKDSSPYAVAAFTYDTPM